MSKNKFRVWDKKRKEMSHDPNYILSSDGLLYWQFGYESKFCDQDNYKVMFYVKKKDKNGKEIYKEDIVRSEYEKGVAVVKFGEGYQGEPADGMYPYWGWYTDGWFERYAFDGSELEIIGNTYENPELLKEK